MFVDEDVAIEDVGSGDGHFEFILEIDGEDIVIVCVFGAHIYQLTKNYDNLTQMVIR
jgi:hypothetical protein